MQGVVGRLAGAGFVVCSGAPVYVFWGDAAGVGFMGGWLRRRDRHSARFLAGIPAGAAQRQRHAGVRSLQPREIGRWPTGLRMRRRVLCPVGNEMDQTRCKSSPVPAGEPGRNCCVEPALPWHFNKNCSRNFVDMQAPQERRPAEAVVGRGSRRAISRLQLFLNSYNFPFVSLSSRKRTAPACPLPARNRFPCSRRTDWPDRTCCSCWPTPRPPAVGPSF